MAEYVEPAISETDGGHKYYVSPQEQYDAAREFLTCDGDSGESEISASLDEAEQGACGIDNRYFVRVRELIYPGVVDAERQDTELIDDKWLYVFLDGEVVVEAKADGPDAWAANVGEVGTNGEIFLDPGPEGSEHSYTFFLSPVILSDEGKAEIADAEDDSLVKETTDRRDIVVALRDPFHWAAKTHSQHYLPKLQAWKEWENNEVQQSELFVASVLKSWVDSDDDSMSIRGHLAGGQPETWIDQYKKELEQRQTATEAACAYLAQVVDSVAYKAVEMSCMRWGDDALSLSFQALACVTGRLNECEPGRQLGASLLADPERMPAQYLFSDTSQGNSLDFGNFRYAWLAALSIFNDLVPEAAKDLRSKGRAPLDAIKLYLESLGVESLKGVYRQVHRNIEDGKDLTAGLNRKKNVRYQTTIGRLNKKAGAWSDAIPTSKQKVGNTLDSLHKNYIEPFDKIIVSVSVIIEVANLGCAVADFLNSKEGDTQKNLISMIGAGGDMGVLVLEIVGNLVKEELKDAVERLGGAAMVVSGVCDAVGFGMEAYDSAGKHDYNSAVGSGIAGAGALIGSGVGLAIMLGVAGATGPVGLGILAFGAVLIVGGSMLATLLQDSPHQQFAEHCFLGEHPARRASQRVEEADELMALLSHFQLSYGTSYNDGRNEHYLYIKPGMVGDGCVFEVQVRREFGNPSLDPQLDATLKIYLNDDDIELTAGESLKNCSQVVRNDDGHVTKIRINIEPGSRTRNGVYDMLWAWARLTRGGDSATTPSSGGWLHLVGRRQGNATGGDPVSSFDEAAIQKG